MLTLLRLTQIFRNLIQTTFNWCIKIEALFFHCKNNIEGHIEGISENDMKKRQIWRRRKKCPKKREMAKHGGVGARHLLGGDRGSARKEWWGFCSLRKDTSQRMAIFSLSLVGAPFNLNGGNAWQYIYICGKIYSNIFSLVAASHGGGFWLFMHAVAVLSATHSMHTNQQLAMARTIDNCRACVL